MELRVSAAEVQGVHIGNAVAKRAEKLDFSSGEGKKVEVVLVVKTKRLIAGDTNPCISGRKYRF